MVEIKDLSFSYKKREKLFSGLNLTIEPGNVYGLLGKNGVGKTTLLKIISGLLFPKDGECTVHGYNASKRKVEMLQDIYFIPEELFTPSVTVGEYQMLNAPFYPKFDSKTFSDFIDEFGLSRKDKLTSFSYGQKKKFLLAFGLSANCSLFILDEPSNGLDIPSKSQFRKLLASSISEDKSFIISTHQVRDMENLIDPIIILDKGEIIFHHTMEEISRNLSNNFQQSEPAGTEIIYSERVPGGYSVLSKNSGKDETRIDLEVLFNAVTEQREKVSSLFTAEVSNAR